MTDPNKRAARQDAERDVDSVESDDSTDEVESKALGLDNLPEVPSGLNLSPEASRDSDND